MLLFCAFVDVDIVNNSEHAQHDLTCVHTVSYTVNCTVRVIPDRCERIGIELKLAIDGRQVLRRLTALLVFVASIHITVP